MYSLCHYNLFFTHHILSPSLLTLCFPISIHTYLMLYLRLISYCSLSLHTLSHSISYLLILQHHLFLLPFLCLRLISSCLFPLCSYLDPTSLITYDGFTYHIGNNITINYWSITIQTKCPHFDPIRILRPLLFS